MGTVGRNQPHRQELDETRRNKKMCQKTEDAGETLGQDDNHAGGCQKSCHFHQVGLQAMKMKPRPRKGLVHVSHIPTMCSQCTVSRTPSSPSHLSAILDLFHQHFIPEVFVFCVFHQNI